VFGNKLCKLNCSKERERSSRLFSRDLQREGWKSRREGKWLLDKHVSKAPKKDKENTKIWEIKKMDVWRIKGRRATLGKG